MFSEGGGEYKPLPCTHAHMHALALCGDSEPNLLPSMRPSMHAPMHALAPFHACAHACTRPIHAVDAVAWGAYVDSAKTASNFGKLRVKTNSQYDDALQMRAAGFIEGYLSAGAYVLCVCVGGGETSKPLPKRAQVCQSLPMDPQSLPKP